MLREILLAAFSLHSPAVRIVNSRGKALYKRRSDQRRNETLLESARLVLTDNEPIAIARQLRGMAVQIPLSQYQGICRVVTPIAAIGESPLLFEGAVMPI